MMRMLLALLLLGLASAHAQEPVPLQKDYSVTKSTSLSGTAEVITIQQPSENARNVRGRFCHVYSSANPCAVTVERNGTAATTTTLAVVPFRSSVPAAAVQAFSASNVGSGTVIGNYLPIPTQPALIDISFIEFRGQGAVQTDNFTLRTASCTTTVTINCVLYEY